MLSCNNFYHECYLILASDYSILWKNKSGHPEHHKKEITGMF